MWNKVSISCKICAVVTNTNYLNYIFDFCADTALPLEPDWCTYVFLCTYHTNFIYLLLVANGLIKQTVMHCKVRHQIHTRLSDESFKKEFWSHICLYF